MNILLLVPGGVGRPGTCAQIPALVALIERISQRHKVRVVALHQEPEPSEYDLAGARIFNLGQTWAPFGLSLVRRFQQLRFILSRQTEKFDVVHSFWFGHASTLALAIARWLHVPMVASLGGGELVSLKSINYGGKLRLGSRLHVRVALLAADRITAGSRYALTPILKHRSDALWIPLFPALNPAQRIAVGWDSRPDSTAQECHPTEDRSPASGGREAAGGSAHDLASQFGGIPCSTGGLTPDRSPEEGSLRILTVSSINRVKDPETLLLAFRQVLDRIPTASLEWVGEDILGGDAQRLAVTLGIADRVRFCGYVTQADLPSYYAHAHVYVQASQHESQGVAVCEAAAAGLPIVGTDVGILSELAPSAAVAVPVANSAALADAVTRVLSTATLATDLSRHAQAWSRQYTADWTAERFENLYAEVARRTNGERRP